MQGKYDRVLRLQTLLGINPFNLKTTPKPFSARLGPSLLLRFASEMIERTAPEKSTDFVQFELWTAIHIHQTSVNLLPQDLTEIKFRVGCAEMSSNWAGIGIGWLHHDVTDSLLIDVITTEQLGSRILNSNWTYLL